MYRENQLKRRLAEGGKCLGAWAALGSAGATEIMALAGFDFIVFDHEHGPASLMDLGNDLRALTGTRSTAILRVPQVDIGLFKRVLDLGVEGLMIPNVETAEEAKRIVAACRYPPQGFRGSAYQGARASGFGIEAERYRDTINGNLVLMAQIESTRGVDNVEAIAAVEGIDVLFIGINDLGGSIGKLDNLDHPEVLKLVERIESATRKAGKKLGGIPHRGMDAHRVLESGYDLCAGFVDSITLRLAAVATVAEHRRRHP